MTNISESIIPINELPKGWILSPISSLAKFNPAAINGNYPHKSIEYLDIANVSSGSYGNPTTLQLEDAPSRAKRIVVDNDVILSTVRPGNRAYAYMHDVKPNLIVSTGFVVLQATNSDSRYLYYIVTSNPVIDYLASIAEEKTAYPSVNPSDIEEIIVPVPPLSEQRAIAHILGTLDDKIELNRRMNETLEGIARALFKSWFIDFDPVRAKAEGRQPFGMNEETAALFPDQFEDSELGEIPKGWKIGSIYDIAEVQYGAPFSSKLFNNEGAGLPLVRIRDLESCNPDIFTLERIERDTVVHAGDILVGMDGEFKVTTWYGPNSLLNQRVCMFVPKDNVPRFYLKYILEKPISFFERSKVGTTIIHLCKSDIDIIRVLVPNHRILSCYNTLTNNLYNIILYNHNQNNILMCIRNLLLPKLISGKIRIDPSKFGFDSEENKAVEV